jgi:hypothetical protein
LTQKTDLSSSGHHLSDPCSADPNQENSAICWGLVKLHKTQPNTFGKFCLLEEKAKKSK